MTVRPIEDLTDAEVSAELDEYRRRFGPLRSQETCPDCGKPYGIRKRCYVCESPRRRTGEVRQCEQCKGEFYVPGWHLKDPRAQTGRYCSRACKHEAQRGKERVKGTRRVRPDGYVVVKTGIRSYDMEHRVLMAQAIGRPLLREEQVHHKNDNPSDNRLENLELVTPAEHLRRHDWPQTRSRRIAKTCELCGAPYDVKASRVHLSRYCSNACRMTAMHEGNRKT